MKPLVRALIVAAVATLVAPRTAWSYIEFVPIGGNPNYYSKALAGLSRDGSTAYLAMASSPFVVAQRYAVDLGTTAVSPAPVPLAIASQTVAPIVSATGRFFVFDSPDATLVAGDTNNEWDSFIYDSLADTIERVSVTNAGGQLPGGYFTAAVGVSTDGRFVAFESHAPNVVLVDTNGSKPDLFIRDRCLSNGFNVAGCSPTTTLVSFGPAGIQAADGCYASAPQSMSDDGRWVVFDCFTDVATFAPGNPCPVPPFASDPTRCQGVYLRDTCRANGALVSGCSPTTELVNRTPTGDFAHAGDAERAVVSGDGSRVAYPAYFNGGVIAGDGPFTDQGPVYLFDHASGTTRRVSEDRAPNDSYLTLGIDADGTHVLVKGDDQTFDVVFIWADCPALAPVCGDAYRTAGCEECDDGNLVDGDGCDSNCRKTGCGSGVVTGTELCDDGNQVDGDGCDTNCTPTGCGNGIRTAGEQCDDGNVLDGDGCSSTCTLEPENLMTGGGNGATTCFSEFLTRPRPLVKHGKLDKSLVCTDDDPTCDQGSVTGDHACTFRLEQCFNLTNPLIPDCTPQDVSRISIQAPRDSDRAPTAELQNRGSFNLAYNNAGAAYEGHCTAPADVIGDVCTEDASCDSDAPGKCGPLAFEFTPALTTSGFCTQPIFVTVPLKNSKGVYKKAGAKMALKVQPTNDPITGAARKADTDKIKFVCNP